MSDVPNAMAALLVRAPREDGESLGGFALRLAHHNGLSNPAWLANLGLPSVLASGLGMARWCVACLAGNSPIWTDTWTKGPAICSVHRCWLEDKCPECKRRMSWRCARLLSCRCGADFLNCDVSPWSAEVTAVLSSCSDESGESWTQLDVHSRWRVAKLLGALDVHGLLGKPLKRASAASVEAERRLITVGASLMVGAPLAIPDLFDRIRVRTPGGDSAQLVGNAFPGLLFMLRARLDTKARDWLMEHLQAYARVSLGSDVPVHWRQRATKSSSAATSVGKQLGVRPERVESLAVRFGVTPAKRVAPSGRRMMSIAPSDVEKLRAGLVDGLSMSAAADRFGLSIPRLNRLLTAGFLKRAGDGVSAASIAELVGQIAQHAGPANRGARASMLSLPEAMRLLVPAARTVDFVRALGRSIPISSASATCATFRDLYVHREHLDGAYRRGPFPEGMYSIPELAKVLCLKQEVTYHLIKVGLLRPVVRLIGRRPARFVELAEIKRFQASFAPLARLTDSSKSGTTQAQDQARAMGLELVSGPSIDGGRQYFVRVAACNKPSGDHHE